MLVSEQYQRERPGRELLFLLMDVAAASSIVKFAQEALSLKVRHFWVIGVLARRLGKCPRARAKGPRLAPGNTLANKVSRRRSNFLFLTMTYDGFSGLMCHEKSGNERQSVD
jgi:hypothetical protein